jgi:hypothetical protein
MSHCDRTQEKIARDDALSSEERAHVLACDRCAALAAEFSLLESALDALAHDVPSAFAERVMALIADEPASRPWLERRWVSLVVAYAGGVIALANVARFLASVLSANLGLGGVP